jgi:tRNA wybutosine-synthesizing protein 1
MTLVRGHNNGGDFVIEFARMMSEGNPHFIELKSYMHVGMSTERLDYGDMLEMDEVRAYADRLCAAMPSFGVMDESAISRIVVLQNKECYVDRQIGA